MRDKQLVSTGERGTHGLGHRIVNDPHDALARAVVVCAAGFDIKTAAALNPLDALQATVVNDIGGLGRPRGNGADAGDYQKKFARARWRNWPAIG